MKLGLAFKMFYKVLVDPAVAVGAEALLSGAALQGPAAATEGKGKETQGDGKQTKEKQKEKPKEKPQRGEALNLLAALQREARFVDFVQEPIQDFSDAEVGAAARDVHKGCRDVLARVFDLKPAVESEEGTTVELPKGFDAGRYRVVGNVTGQPPYQGQLVHHGWEARKVDVPTWTGPESSQRVAAPAEVELK